MAAEDELRDCRKGAISDMRQARRWVGELEEKAREPVVVVGMDCRLPGHIATSDSPTYSPHGWRVADSILRPRPLPWRWRNRQCGGER